MVEFQVSSTYLLLPRQRKVVDFQVSSAYLLLQSQTKTNCGVPSEQYLSAAIEPVKERIAAPGV